MIEFTRVFNASIDEHLEAVRIDDKSALLYLELVNRGDNGRMSSILQIHIIHNYSGHWPGKRIQVNELKKAGVQRVSIYSANYLTNEDTRDDTDYEPNFQDSNTPSDLLQGLANLRERVENDSLSRELGYNGQAVDVEEIAKLEILIKAA